jgi:glycosyltransferase involved in cell wall biosynthesis
VRVVAIYADRLRRMGHDVVVVSRPPRPATLRERLRAGLTRRPRPSATRRVPSYFGDLGVDHRVIGAHRPITAADVPDADVVVATWWETAEWVADFPASKGAKVYFVQHYEAHGGQPADRVDATWRLPMHKVTIARWLADLARDRFDDADVSLVRNAVDLGQFNAPPRGKQLAPTVGVMYSAVEFKGCDVSLKAFDMASRSVPRLRLVAFGNRRPTPDLPLPGGAEYHLTPPQGGLKDIYGRCDAWLFGSRSEGFGLPILEAMACRTPVIATPAGAAPELVGEGGGVLVPPEDATAMARAIETVVGQTEAAWRAMSDQAYGTASRYTWDDAAALFEAALRRAAGRAGRAELSVAAS